MGQLVAICQLIVGREAVVPDAPVLARQATKAEPVVALAIAVWTNCLRFTLFLR